MSKKLYEETDIQAIATAIRTKNGQTSRYKVSQMADAINSISVMPSTCIVAYDSSSKLIAMSAMNAGNLPGYSFYKNDKITSVSLSIQNSLQVVGLGISAFEGCTKLTTFPFSETEVSSILNRAFFGCSSLVLTSLPSTLTGVGANVFDGCSNLSITTTPDTLTILETGLFNNCTGITTMTIPATVTAVRSLAFGNCAGLTTVTFKGTPSVLNAQAFEGCTNLATINVPWAENAIAGAPWGATSATINYGYTG